jgi:hypothetical protein
MRLCFFSNQKYANRAGVSTGLSVQHVEVRRTGTHNIPDIKEISNSAYLRVGEFFIQILTERGMNDRLRNPHTV